MNKPRGEIELNISGGTPFTGGEYDFDWGGSNLGRSATPSVTRVGNGDYTVVVRDSLGCAATDTYSLNTTEVTVLPSFLAAECDGVPTGQITLVASGGDPNADLGFRFRIAGEDNFGNGVNRSMSTNSDDSFTFDNLPAGTYIAWAEDEDLVSMTCEPVTVEITVTTIISYDIVAVPNPDMTATCPNTGDLSMELTLSNTSANPASSYDYTVSSVDSDGNVTTLPVSSGTGLTDNVIIECLPFGGI